jgi:hypothetical protein
MTGIVRQLWQSRSEHPTAGSLAFGCTGNVRED